MDTKYLPIPVKRGLVKLGTDLQNARKRRRIPTKLAAERAGISRTTLNKIEKGTAGVSLGAYSKVLFILGLAQRLADLADPRFDDLGLDLDAEMLPKRIRFSKEKK